MPVSARTTEADRGRADPSLYSLMQLLEREYQRCLERSKDRASHGAERGRHPSDGGDWLDWHFRAEAIFGLLSSLRFGRDREEAVADGVADAEHAASLWNSGRGRQVRCGWVEDWLHNLLLVLGG